MKAASSPATEPNFYMLESCPAEGPLKTACDDGDDELVVRTVEVVDVPATAATTTAPPTTTPP